MSTEVSRVVNLYNWFGFSFLSYIVTVPGTGNWYCTMGRRSASPAWLCWYSCTCIQHITQRCHEPWYKTHDNRLRTVDGKVTLIPMRLRCTPAFLLPRRQHYSTPPCCRTLQYIWPACQCCGCLSHQLQLQQFNKQTIYPLSFCAISCHFRSSSDPLPTLNLTTYKHNCHDAILCFQWLLLIFFIALPTTPSTAPLLDPVCGATPWIGSQNVSHHKPPHVDNTDLVRIY